MRHRSNTSVRDNNVLAKSNKRRRNINVEEDFNGNLESAIAAANDGDVIQLDDKKYVTTGITIDKDITVRGQEGSIVDGRGTSQPIFNLTPEASGATIENVEITNGNVGVHSHGATDLTLQNLEIHNIGISETFRDGHNNTGINLVHADGFEILNSNIHNIGKKGVGISDTDGGTVSGLTLEDINIDAEHAQSFDAAGIKLFNTNEVTVSDNNLSGINAFHIWNDITNSTTIEGNTITDVGKDFLAPTFNQNVTVSGIYNEKSYESVVENNNVISIGRFLAFDATEFTTETMVLGTNSFSSLELNTEDYWANEEAEKFVAITEDPYEADFSLFENDFYAEANIG